MLVAQDIWTNCPSQPNQVRAVIFNISNKTLQRDELAEELDTCQRAVKRLGYDMIVYLCTYLEHNVPEEFLHLTFFGVVGDLVGEASGSPSSLWFGSLSLSSRTDRSVSHNKMVQIIKDICADTQNSLLRIGLCWPTLFRHRGILYLVLLVLPLIRDFACNRAGHIQFVDVQGGLAEWGHGWVHACIAIWGAAEGSQVKSFAPSDDGDVEGELAPAVWGWVLGDGERRRWGELSAGPWGGGRLSIEEFTVLTAGKE